MSTGTQACLQLHVKFVSTTLKKLNYICYFSNMHFINHVHVFDKENLQNIFLKHCTFRQ